MVPSDVARAYIYRLCHEIGANADSIYNAKTGAWYFAAKSTTIEVFLTSFQSAEKERTFIRCFAPLCGIPADTKRKLDMYQAVLEINTQRPGIKLSVTSDKRFLCAVSERDIDGMDYQEFLTIVTDISFWADQLSDFFKKHFNG
jgi:hypothetical protein